MIDALKWTMLVLGLLMAAGTGIFVAAAIVLASRADDEMEAALR